MQEHVAAAGGPQILGDTREGRDVVPQDHHEATLPILPLQGKACYKPGHKKKDCPGNVVTCHNCIDIGHMVREFQNITAAGSYIGVITRGIKVTGNEEAVSEINDLKA